MPTLMRTLMVRKLVVRTLMVSTLLSALLLTMMPMPTLLASQSAHTHADADAV